MKNPNYIDSYINILKFRGLASNMLITYTHRMKIEVVMQFMYDKEVIVGKTTSFKQ